MAIFHVYFDESGKKDDHPTVTFTGVCLLQSRLEKFDEEWNALLRRYGLRSLHMARASRLKENNGPKMPRHQSIADRIEALKPFADCINAHFEMGLIQAFDVQGFNALTVDAKKGLGSPNDPYYLAFVRGLLELAEYVHDDDRISLICDDDPQTAWDCYQHYRAVRRIEPKVQKKIISLSFADDEYFPALQAADMAAFLARGDAKRIFYTEYSMYRKLFVHLVKPQGTATMQWNKMFADKEKLRSLGESLGNIK